jgi:hypothetical protein
MVTDCHLHYAPVGCLAALPELDYVGSHYTVRKDSISSLVTEYPNGRFMR